MEKNIKDNSDNMKDDDKAALTEKLSNLKKAKEGENLSDIQKAIEELNSTWSGIAATMQKQGSSQNNTASKKGSNQKGATNTKNKEDEIEDADFEVVD